MTTMYVTNSLDRTRIAIVCAHHEVDIEQPARGSEGLRTTLAKALALHNCRCQPDRIITTWPSLAEAIEDTRRSIEDLQTTEVSAGHAAMLHHQQAFLATRTCTSCDPTFEQDVTAGVVRNKLLHQEQCTKPETDYRPTELAWLDNEPGTA